MCCILLVGVYYGSRETQGSVSRTETCKHEESACHERERDVNDRRLYRAATTLGVLLSVILLGIPPAAATEFRTGDAVHITEGEILDDLFAAGRDIDLEADVLGDFIAFGRTITVGDGATVDNSVMCGGQRVDINGRVRNSVRVFGRSVTVRGHIERNLMCFARSVIVDAPAWVEKDITLMAGEVLIRGRVGGDLKGVCGTVTISGQIDGDVNVEADRIVVQSTAIIGGRLKYRSEQDATIAEGAQILGGVEAEPFEGGGYSFWEFFWDAWWVMSSLATGAFLLILFRPFVSDVVSTISGRPATSLGLGLLFLVGLPLAALPLALLFVGVLVALAYVVLIYLAKIFVGLALGSVIMRRVVDVSSVGGSLLSLLVGMVIVHLVIAITDPIPYHFGLLISAVIWSLGIGAFFLTAYKRNKPGVAP